MRRVVEFFTPRNDFQEALLIFMALILVLGLGVLIGVLFGGKT
jgi:hypothetical protein